MRERGPSLLSRQRNGLEDLCVGRDTFHARSGTGTYGSVLPWDEWSGMKVCGLQKDRRECVRSWPVDLGSGS